MTVSNETTVRALAFLDRANLNAAKVGQAAVWAQVINSAVPKATDATMIAAVEKLAETRTSDGKGGSWVTVGDLVAQMKSIRQVESQAEERQAAQLEPPTAPMSQDVKRLWADAQKAARTTPTNTPASLD